MDTEQKLRSALESACKYLPGEMRQDIEAETFDYSKARMAAYNPKYVNALLEIRSALGRD